MDSGLFIGVFSAWEVILTALLLMFLLPLVFYVASAKSRPKRPGGPAKHAHARQKPVPQPAEDAEAKDDERERRPRRAEPPDGEDGAE